MADLIFGSFDCRTSDRSVRLDLIEGFWESADVRGDDAVIVGKPGLFQLDRVPEKLLLHLSGWIIGLGDTAEERWESFYDTKTSLRDAFSKITTDILTVTAPYLGLDSGTASLNARCVNIVSGPVNSLAMQHIEIELECVDSPPEWVVEGSS